MALFGGSKSTSSTSQESVQLGAEAGNDIAQYYVPGTLNVVDEFPEPIAAYAQGLLGLTGKLLDSAQTQGNIASGAIATLGNVAEREKTPLTEWLPLVAVGAAALVAVAFFTR